MKCKTFKIHLQSGKGNFDEDHFNSFLEKIAVTQIFASIVNNEFWSIAVFYENDAREIQSFVKTENVPEIKLEKKFPPIKSFADEKNKSKILRQNRSF